ncbi:MAG: pectate lyase [Planctomycetes bacterium]|nr:pectate lyase [Planctomycetota bacterium]MBL7142722.1 pectate lyase [Phycisphaerae bacterium]
MKMSRRYTKVGLLLLGIPLLLWILILLFLFRVVNIFDAWLMKFPGPLVIWTAMSLCPVAAIYLGVKMLRAKQGPFMARIFAAMGTFLLVAFIVLIGAPMVNERLKPKTPINPSTPRPVEPQIGLPVFPGAEGFGTRTIAGRGGKVVEVTSLAGAGPGTLRAALNVSSPRIIVFRVAGTIELKSELQILNPFLTLAGQTAPGGGVCIKGAGIAIMTHDVLIQHIRVRPGNKGPVDADINDAISIMGKYGGQNDDAYNVVVDHVSASWGEDETVSTWYGAHDITISWCIISEALNRSRHRKKTHSAGLLIGDSSYNVSIHHNLLAHNDFRNPLISQGGTHDIVNNVIYNWGVLPAEICDYNSNTFLNFIGNYFIAGSSTNPGPFEILFPEGNPKIFVKDNIGPHRPDPNMDDWAIVGFRWGDEGIAPEQYRSHTKFETPPITSTSPIEAHDIVLAQAGATTLQRDAVDQRIVNDVRNGTGSIIDSPDDVGGYPELAGGTPPVDTDHDGMPDDWELNNGLDPHDASDGNGDLDRDGYTNIEEYLHSLSPQE